MEFVKGLKLYWDITDGEDRKLLAHSLFDETVYNLDGRRIVDFKFKAWAEPFLMMRAGVYQAEMGEKMKNRFNGGVSRVVLFLDPNGSRASTAITGRDCRMVAHHRWYSSLAQAA